MVGLVRGFKNGGYLSVLGLRKEGLQNTLCTLNNLENKVIDEVCARVNDPSLLPAENKADGKKSWNPS